jgi:hypothetical protein
MVIIAPHASMILQKRRLIAIRVMAKKYVCYISVVDGEEETFERYSAACIHYGQGDAPKTLYGVDEQGEQSVIFSEL